MPFGLTAPHTPTPLLIFSILVFFVFRSSFQFLGRSTAPSPAVPVITSSGRVATISVGDTVLLVEDVKYRVQKLFPSDGTVVLQKINTRDRPFKRFISQLWVPPPSTHDAVADVDMPLAPCLCPDPEPPRLLPDTCDSTTQVDIPSTTTDLDKWCSLMTDYSSVDRLLMAHSLSQTEQIGELRSRLPDKQPPLLPFLGTLLLTLPTDFTDDNTPDDSFYHFLCVDPAADQTTLASNANTLLRFLHPDKSPNTDDPAVKAAAHLVPLITHIKRVLTIPALRLVYDHCGLTGLQRLLSHKLRCLHCMPVDETGRPLRQGPLEFPQLHLLLTYSP